MSRIQKTRFAEQFGRRRMTDEVAARLSKATGLPARYLAGPKLRLLVVMDEEG